MLADGPKTAVLGNTITVYVTFGHVGRTCHGIFEHAGHGFGRFVVLQLRVTVYVTVGHVMLSFFGHVVGPRY